VALLFLDSIHAALSEGIPLGTNVTVSFANVEVGREILSQRDEFIAALTPLDRRARMQSTDDVSELDFLAFVGGSVQPWIEDETNRIAGALQTVGEKLARWQSLFPPSILLIKTSGREEFNNCYTRQNAIVFPAAEIGGRPSALRHLILHELFHVLTRHDPELRRTLYACIGFKPINEIELSDELCLRKVTNPDGVQNGWIIGLTNQSEFVQTVPILLATGPDFNPNQGGVSPFDYFRLLVVKRGSPGWVPQLVDGHPRLLKPEATTGWFEQIGRNTRYTIHPDEILAENFVHLVNGNTNLPTPRIITEMANTVTQWASKKRPRLRRIKVRSRRRHYGVDVPTLNSRRQFFWSSSRVWLVILMAWSFGTNAFTR